MAVFITDNSQVSIDNNAGTLQDISDQVTSGTISLGRNEIEATHINDDTDLTEPGNKTISVDLDIDLQFGSGNVEEILWELFNGGSKGTLEVLPDAGSAVSASNPKYSLEVTWTSYPDIGGEAGEKMSGTLSGTAAGAISRATS